MSHTLPADEPHVLFVNTRDGLGADVAVHMQLARCLPAVGVRVSFTINRTATDAAAMRRQLAQNPAVRVLESWLGGSLGGAQGGERLRRGGRNVLAGVGVARLAAAIVASGVDLLHATDRPRDAVLCVLLGRLTGRPTILHMHSNFYPGFPRLSRWAFARCSCLVGVSTFTSRSLVAAGYPAERVATIHNAIDVEHFQLGTPPGGRARAAAGIPAEAPLVGLVGRYIPSKGHADLLAALAQGTGQLAGAHALFVGDLANAAPGYIGELRAQVARLGLADRVVFSDFQDDIRPVMADLDVLAVPSWDEPFGLVIAEAMAMATPVVAYRAGGVPEIIEHERDGLLVPPRDTAALAAALAGLLAAPEQRTKIGAAGREAVRARFSTSAQGRAMAALYRRVLRSERVVEHAIAVHG